MTRSIFMTICIALCVSSTCGFRIINGQVFGDGDTQGRSWLKPSEKAEADKAMNDAESMLSNMRNSFSNFPGAASSLEEGTQSVAKSRANINNIPVREGRQLREMAE